MWSIEKLGWHFVPDKIAWADSPCTRRANASQSATSIVDSVEELAPWDTLGQISGFYSTATCHTFLDMAHCVSIQLPIKTVAWPFKIRRWLRFSATTNFEAYSWENKGHLKVSLASHTCRQAPSEIEALSEVKGSPWKVTTTTCKPYSPFGGIADFVGMVD